MEFDRDSTTFNSELAPLVKAVRELRGQSEDEARWGYLEKLASSMESVGHAREDTVRTMFGMVGDRWSTLILFALKAGEWRYGALKRIVSTLAAEEQITKRILTLKLRTLEREGLVSHTLEQGPRISSTYTITTLGREMVEIVEKIVAWVESRHEIILKCREEFEERYDDHGY